VAFGSLEAEHAASAQAISITKLLFEEEDMLL